MLTIVTLNTFLLNIVLDQSLGSVLFQDPGGLRCKCLLYRVE